MTTIFDFEGKTAIVTGGASGIGAAIATLLVEGGATVFAVDRDPSTAPEGCKPIAVDVSNWQEMSVMTDDVLASTGRIDAMFNNAGVNAYTNILDATVEEFDQIVAVNARGVFIGMKAVLPHMLAAGQGAIVNTASNSAKMAIADRASYTASKGAVIAMTRQVAVQYAARGVRCNCINPGSTDSPMVADIIAKSEDPAARRLQIQSRQPIGRMARPEEIASAAVFLASDRASFITGVDLDVDGGWTAA
ncbi:SDR family oxidoreductase [Rhodococcus sp. USK10]|uniref:Short chain dehydrogenase n=1 Tax=Rhodococcus wratislaviensis TaxID=44752 RepID=A0A402CEX6_RHOWR|nr:MULTISPECIES: SDR family oxidoreductase [Rhodococcus]QYB07108.1 SDR family oxidoreductase [Rhodococcus sp. USK10]GCE42134.1 short chain dehydrogenase [Rhodococcus wratislaviensis]